MKTEFLLLTIVGLAGVGWMLSYLNRSHKKLKKRISELPDPYVNNKVGKTVNLNNPNYRYSSGTSKLKFHHRSHGRNPRLRNSAEDLSKIIIKKDDPTRFEGNS